MRFAKWSAKLLPMLLSLSLTACSFGSKPANAAPTNNAIAASNATSAVSAPALSSKAAVPVTTVKTDKAQANTNSNAPAIDFAITPAIQAQFDDANRALQAGQIDKAQRAYQDIIKVNSQIAGAHANLGIIYRNANKLDDAVAELAQAVQLSPKQAAYQNQLGVTYRQLGQFDKARTAYEHAIEIDANYAAAVLNLGILHDMYLRDHAKAIELYTRYLALTPQGDAVVSKWLAELKNRKPAPSNVKEK